MKRPFLNISLVFGIGLIMSSCIVANVIQTEVLRPAKLYFHSDVYRVGVVARMDMEVKKLTLQDKSISHRFFERDSAIIKDGVLGVLDGIAESPRFEAYQVDPERVVEINELDVMDPFAWSVVNKLCEKDSIDLLISLTKASFREKIVTRNGEYQDYYSFVLFPKLHVRFYDLSTRQISRYVYQDTIELPLNRYVDKIADSIKFKYYVRAMGIAGYRFSKNLAPSWAVENRVWFPSGNKSFRKAGKLASAGDWLGASAIWRRAFDNDGKAVASKAAFNLAVAAEMNDKLDLSMVWLEKASELGLKEFPKFYMEIIKQRQAVRPILEAQMK